MKTLSLKLLFATTCVAVSTTLALYTPLQTTEKDVLRGYYYTLDKNNKPQELPKFAELSIIWLASVQSENGSWGAGSHQQQDIKNTRNVQADPATTAFAAMALLRAGNTLEKGVHKNNLQKALNYLLAEVETSSEEDTRITKMQGTQPQVKLGQNIDATMCVQFLLRIVPHTENDVTLKQRTENAINKCLRKIQKTQQADGSISGGSWAPVLQSAMANNAMEQAYNMNFDVDKGKLEKSREYQRGGVATDGKVSAERGAGVELYSIASSQRASAVKANKANESVINAKKSGKLRKDDAITEDNLMKADEKMTRQEAKTLMDSYKQNEATIDKMQDKRVLAGFGNNGGEEFLSFMMTSESLVITGGEAGENWQKKMHEMLKNIQNQDGSWNGHHCITSPVFCTAASILALTAENDRELLLKERKEKDDKKEKKEEKK